MEVDCKNGFHEIEAKRELFIEQSDLQNESLVTERIKQAITEAIQNPHAYSQPFSYASSGGHGHGHHGGSGIAGMVGGMAMGLLGGMLIGELMDDFIGEDMLEGAAEEFGFEEEEQVEEGGFDFGDFFGGDDEF